MREAPDVVKRFVSYFEDCPCHSLVVRRDEMDSFEIELSPMGGMQGALGIPDVLPILPAGSTWSQASGWHSFIGIPLQTANRYWLALGVEAILPHESRGAYPYFHALLFPFDVPPEAAVERLSAFTRDSYRDLDPGGVRPNEVVPGVIRSRARSPSEHRLTEITILKLATSLYAQNQLVWFRTLITSEEGIRNLGYPGAGVPYRGSKRRPRFVFDDYLTASSATIDQHFSPEFHRWRRANRSRRAADVPSRGNDRDTGVSRLLDCVRRLLP
jgi:hypothetical protein